uniref:hypothetical protein n=1 Tax=Endozoicomonas sp. ONNA2 TaxID=2828741 RepID=UPI00214821A1
VTADATKVPGQPSAVSKPAGSGSSSTRLQPLKPGSVTADTTKLTGQRSAVSKPAGVSSSSTGRQTDDIDQVHSEPLHQALTTPKPASNTALSATKIPSLAESESLSESADDIKQTSQTKIEKKPPHKKKRSATQTFTQCMPCCTATKRPGSRNTDKSTRSQGTKASEKQKKSDKRATPLKRTRFAPIHRKAQKQPQAPLATAPDSGPAPNKSVSGAKKAATVGTPSESDKVRTRSIEITYASLGRHFEVCKQTFATGTTLEDIQQFMNTEISNFKSSSRKRKHSLRARISSEVKGLGDSKKTFSFDMAKTENAKLQGSAAIEAYQQETASLLDKLKNAETEQDSSFV